MKELEDSPYFPKWLRNFQTEFIGFVVVRFNIYVPFIKYINFLKLPKQEMFDLCSGSGQPAIHIFNSTNCFDKLILSDKFPNSVDESVPDIVYLSESLDVLKMEFQPSKFYTMFNAFHHFDDAEKMKILKRLIDSNSTGFFVEVLEPTFICLLKTVFMTTIGNLIVTPFITPFSFSRLFFTYIIPINIITVTYDGIISVLKSRSRIHYKKLFAHLGDSVTVFRLKNKISCLVVIRTQPK